MLKKLHSSSVLKLVLLLVVIGTIFVVLELTNTVNILHKKQPAVTTGSTYSAKGEVSTSNSAKTDQSSSNTNSVANDKTAPVNTYLAQPSGNFVSNHHPNLGGSPAPNSMSSVCVTVPGATCAIQFTKGDEVKSLSKKTAGSDGSAYWDWKLQDIGLSEGTWTIKAVTELSGNSKTSEDTMKLEVGA